MAQEKQTEQKGVEHPYPAWWAFLPKQQPQTPQNPQPESPEQ